MYSKGKPGNSGEPKGFLVEERPRSSLNPILQASSGRSRPLMSPLETMETQTEGETGYRGRIANSERPREERSAVLVERSTGDPHQWIEKVGKCRSATH
jgi:hypothetical protein